MSTIQDLERKVRSLEDQLSAARLSLDAAKREIYPVKIGDIVLRGVQKWRVTSVVVRGWNPDANQTNYWNRPQIYGNKQKKDGTWGRAEFHIYGEWEKVQP